MRRSILLSMMIALTAAASCNTHEEIDPLFLGNETVSLEIKGTVLFRFDDNSGQLGHNTGTHTFTAGNDDMTEYLWIRCSDEPLTEGQTVTADMKWCAGSATQSRRSQSLKVVKTDDQGHIWLWSGKDNVRAIVRRLD